MTRFLIATALGGALFAQPAHLSSEKTAALRLLFDQERERQAIAGYSVALGFGGEFRWSGGFGYADLENQVPAKAATVYRLGSISKPITAVAAMQLVEKGKLDLDAPVQRYVPTFPQKQWTVTTRQLLGHLGGIRHYKGAEIASTRRYHDVLEPLGIFKDDPLIHEPGTKYSYTTYGYNLAGAAVEAAAGMPFLEYLKASVFGPAGMAHIQNDDVFAIIPNRSRGYTKNGEGKIQNSILADTSNKLPGGGLVSTAEDLVRFALAVEKGTLLTPRTRELMFRSLRTKEGQSTGYGLGWQHGKSGAHRTLFHGGSQPGCKSLLTMFPDDGLVVAIMTNSEHARPAEILDAIAKLLLP